MRPVEINAENAARDRAAHKSGGGAARPVLPSSSEPNSPETLLPIPTELPGGILTDARRRYEHAFQTAASGRQFAAEVVETLKMFLQPLAVCRVSIPREPSEPAGCEELFAVNSGLVNSLRPLLPDWCIQAREKRSTVAAKLLEPLAAVVFCIPIPSRDEPHESLVVLLGPAVAASERAAALLDASAVWLALWEIGERQLQSEFEAGSAAGLVELLEHVENAPDVKAAAQSLADDLRQWLGCRQVTVGLCRRGTRLCRVTAVSENEPAQPSSSAIQAMESAMDECGLRDTLTVWPAISMTQRHCLLAHRQFAAAAAAGGVASIPLHDERGEVRGAILAVAAEPFTADSKLIRCLSAAEPRISATMRLLRRADQTFFQRRLDATRARLTPTRRRIALVCGMALLASALLAPADYLVNCDCEIEPTARRYVAAPFEGTLARSHVQPGDLVAAGAQLAEMDGREIRWEQAGVVAEYNRAAKQRDAALASQSIGTAQLAGLEMDRLDQRKRLLEFRSEHTSVKSPIGGVVISGDLKKSEGVRLTVGQRLFEIAPLDEVVVEVAVPVDEISRVAIGQPLEFHLDAYPTRRWSGTIGRIHPRADIRGQESVFIAEVQLRNAEQILRPGMRGQAQLTAGRNPLAWNWFHKSFEKAALWLGW